MLLFEGVGSFTIVDDATVTGKDVGSNFFLLSSQIGESRAKSCCELLQELNLQVKGGYLQKVITTSSHFRALLKSLKKD